MLQGIFDLFSNIGNYISMAWGYVVDFFTNIGNMIAAMDYATRGLTGFFWFLPLGIKTTILVIMAIVVAYKVLGREG